MYLNWGHKWAIVHPRGDLWDWRITVEWYRQKTPGSSITALWQSYQQYCSKEEEREKRIMNLALRNISVHTCKWYLHAVKYPNMGPLALFPLRRKASCWFVSPLEIHCFVLTEPVNLASNAQHANYTTETTVLSVSRHTYLANVFTRSHHYTF